MTRARGLLDDTGVRALRPAKPEVDPWRALDALVEIERGLDGRPESAVTLFLAGAECPFSCVFCDLWQWTLEGPTPTGALPRQIAGALADLGERAREATVVKLYNASNFFDPRAVPGGDLEEIVRLVESFERLVVESHPRLVNGRAGELAAAFEGRVEVAMGLETVHPAALAGLNKKMTLEEFDRAVDRLLDRDIDVRAFVLVGVPFVASEGQLEWTLRSVQHAARRGVGRAALIPLRGGNGAMEILASRGEWAPPRLHLLESALEAALEIEGIVVSADTWDLDRLARCPSCAARRIERLAAMNLAGRVLAAEPCSRCGWPEDEASCSTTS